MRTAWFLAMALLASGCVSVGPLGASSHGCDDEALGVPLPADTPGLTVTEENGRWVARRTVDESVAEASVADRIAVDVQTVNGAIDVDRGVEGGRVVMDLWAKGDTAEEARARLAALEPVVRLHQTSWTARAESDLWCDRGADIEVQVPADRTLHGDIATTNGAIALARTQLENGAVRTVNGEIALRDMTLRSVEVATVNGGLTFDRVRGSGLDAETVNGQIHLLDLDMEGIEARTVNGAIDGHVTASRVLLIGTTNGAVDLMVHPKASLLLTIDAANGPVDLELEERDDIAYDLGLRTNNGGIDVSMDDVTYTGDAKKGRLVTDDAAGRPIQVDGDIETANAGIDVSSAGPR